MVALRPPWRRDCGLEGGGLRRGHQPPPDREADDGVARRVPAWTCAVGRAARLRGHGDIELQGLALLTTALGE